MKKLMKFFAYVLFFIIALMYFTPKVSFFYLLEEQLKPYGVIISSEKLSDRGFSLDIDDAVISYKSIESAQVSNANIKIFVLYNSIKVKDVKLSSTVSSFVPLSVYSANIVYSVLDPFYVKGKLEGEFGEADITYEIAQKRVNIVLRPSKLMLNRYKSTLKDFKQDENGEYVYEKTF